MGISLGNFVNPVAGLGSALGGMAMGGLDIWSGRQAAEDSRTFNREEAQANRDFQREMSNTSYQRAMADMRQAGLNPMLAFMQGGASSPSGGQASTTPASTGSFSNAMSSAVQASRVGAEIDLMKAQAQNARAQANLTDKTMPPADPWRMFYDFIRQTGLFNSAKSTGAGAIDYVKDVVKTYPLVPRQVPYRQPVQPMTERQREQLRNTGSYTRPARSR